MNPKIIATAITLAIIIVFMIIAKSINGNPIIGKWRSETEYPFMGKSVEEIEFTSDSEYSSGIKIRVKYEIEGSRIIVKDETKTGIIYDIIDKDTMTTNIMGMKTVLRRIN